MSLSRTLLAQERIEEALRHLPGWSYQEKALRKDFQFPDFSTTIAFVVLIATIAEKLDHHPDLFIHSWNRLRVTLTTHSAGGVTEYDVAFAQKIEQYAQTFGGTA